MRRKLARGAPAASIIKAYHEDPVRSLPEHRVGTAWAKGMVTEYHQTPPERVDPVRQATYARSK